MSRRILFILITVIIVAIISWIFLFPKEKTSITQEITESPTTYSARETEEIPVFTTLDFQETQEGESQNYINENLSFLKPEIEIFQETAPIVEQFSSIFYENPQQNQINTDTVVPEELELTEAEIEQEIFDKLYPDYFTEGLSFTQDVFEEQDFLNSDYETIESFDSEEKIFAFVNTIIDVFEEQGFYSEEEAIKFRVGANKTWKTVLENDRRFFRDELISSELSKSIVANIIYYTHKKASEKIARIVKEIEKITAQKAYAQDCFRSGGGGPGGANLSAPCCNCGLKCSSQGCVPVDDCGSGGSGCDVQLGCKNLYGAGKAVIWDSSNGICGIG